MSLDLPTPTREFLTASQKPGLGHPTAVQWRSLAFYTLDVFDCATDETLGVYLQRATEADEDAFSRSAAKSAPRSWRDL